MRAAIINKELVCSIIDDEIAKLKFKKLTLMSSTTTHAVQFNYDRTERPSTMNITTQMRLKRASYREILPNHTEVRETLHYSNCGFPTTVCGFWLIRQKASRR